MKEILELAGEMNALAVRLENALDQNMVLTSGELASSIQQKAIQLVSLVSQNV